MDIIQLRNTVLLLLAAVLWGCGYAAQSIGAAFIEPFTFLAARNWLAGFAMLPLLLFFTGQKKRPRSNLKPLLTGGALCGFFLFAATLAQQLGIAHTTAAKAGFISSLYILIVPLMSLFAGKRVEQTFLVCAVMAAAGLYLLCFNEEFSFQKGDLLILLSAVFYACHILTVDRFAKHFNAIALSCVQFFVTAILSTIFMHTLETPHLNDIGAAGGAILFTGLISGGLAYTLQIIGQKRLTPTVAGIVMSLESVFAALAGWVLLHQSLNTNELLGCHLMFCAVIFVQLPSKKKRRQKVNRADD